MIGGNGLTKLAQVQLMIFLPCWARESVIHDYGVVCPADINIQTITVKAQIFSVSFL